MAILGKFRFSDSEAAGTRTESITIYHAKCPRQGKTPKPEMLYFAGHDTRTTIRPIVRTDTLKKAEKAALKDGLPASLRGDLKEVMRHVSGAAKARPMVIDYRLIPKSWFEAEPCNDVTIILEIDYLQKEVSFRAHKKCKLNNESYQAGEEVGDFWVDNPYSFRVLRSAVHNVKCCNDAMVDKPTRTDCLEFDTDRELRAAVEELEQSDAETAAKRDQVYELIKETYD
jgi:hypothetical protein